MKCYNCGCTLSEHDFCTGCGADVGTYKKIIRLSNMFYNEGLRKAQVRDLSGAVASLRQSLKCNKNNIDARNLLGLVHFEMGEPVAALSEWVISKNFKGKKNIADDFLQAIQSNPAKLDGINQNIKKYNQALLYCRQGSLDLAVIQLKKVLSVNPNLIKGYQLLALLYINGEEWDKAKRILMKAAAIDTNNTTTLTYMKEVDRAVALKDEPAGGKKKPQKEDVITYQSGNETIIQPLNPPESSGGTTVLNIVIGLVIGLAIAWFLILPARVKSAQEDINTNLKEVSEQLTTKSATIAETEKRVEALQKENEDLNSQIEEYTGKDGVMQAADYLMQAVKKYMETPEAVLEVADILKNIDASYVEQNASQSFKDLYQYIHADVSTKAATEYVKTGIQALNSNDFETAIADLTKAFEIDATNAEALYNLAHAYRKSENTAKADELYNQVITTFPDTEYARNAKGYLSENVDGTTNNQEETPTAPVTPVVDPNAVPPVTPAPAVPAAQ